MDQKNIPTREELDKLVCKEKLDNALTKYLTNLERSHQFQFLTPVYYYDNPVILELFVTRLASFLQVVFAKTFQETYTKEELHQRENQLFLMSHKIYLSFAVYDPDLLDILRNHNNWLIIALERINQMVILSFPSIIYFHCITIEKSQYCLLSDSGTNEYLAAIRLDDSDSLPIPHKYQQKALQNILRFIETDHSFNYDTLQSDFLLKSYEIIQQHCHKHQTSISNQVMEYLSNQTSIQINLQL